MILMKENKSKFLDFIFQEADGDVPKNRKVVTVKRKGGNKTDYTKGADLEVPEEETPTNNTSDDGGPSIDETDYSNDNNETDEPSPDEPTTDDTDYSDDGSDNSEDNSADDTGVNDSSNDGNTDEPNMDDTDYSDDSSDNSDNDDEGPSMDDTDYSDDSSSEDDSADDSNTDDSSNGDDSNGSQASVDEQARKYSLYRKFMKLNNLLESNTEVLSNTMLDDSEINQKIKSVTSKLKETNRLVSEYMVVKFQTASYIQSMLFYQRVLAIINVNFNILQDLKKHINKK